MQKFRPISRFPGASKKQCKRVKALAEKYKLIKDDIRHVDKKKDNVVLRKERLDTIKKEHSLGL
jgi:hypothetical protein